MTVKAKPAAQHTLASGQRPSGRAVGAPVRARTAHARAAPSTPVAPHPAICHGVHGPWPKKKLEARPASAPTAKPGPLPSAYPDTSTMSVVGLTLGTAAKAIRPSAA